MKPLSNHLTRLGKILALLAVLAFLPFSPAYAQDANDPQAGGEIIIKFKKDASDAQKEHILQSVNAKKEEALAKLGLHVATIPPVARDRVIEALKKHSLVEYAEPNFTATKFVVTNDSLLSNQWGLFTIQAAGSAQTAWDLTTGSNGIKVAILDTGIDESHPDLSGKVVGRANFTNSPTNEDIDGHGTHVAGIVGATTNNGNGVAGTGYNTALMNGKVLNDDGFGDYWGIAQAVIWATDNGANVVNMSLGGPSYSQALNDAINYAWSKGVVVVAAAGNGNTSSPSYPAYFTNVIAVAATDQTDKKASFSNYGGWVDVAAPGVSIFSTYDGGGYGNMSGTSMASPMTAGLAALIFAKGDCSSAVCVRNKIEQNADAISGTGSYWTFGRINAFKALSTNPVQTPSVTPTPTPTPKPVPALTASSISLSYTTLSSYRRIITTVTVVDATTQKPLRDARVYLSLTLPSGKVNTYSGNTNSSGSVTFKPLFKEKGLYKATVTNITKSSYTYKPTVTEQTLQVN